MAAFILNMWRRRNLTWLALVAVCLSGSAHAAVTISAGATVNIICTSGVCTPSKKNAVLNVAQLQSLLASGDVKVTTAGAEASDIAILTAFSWASSHSLTLDAYQSITVKEPVSISGTGGLMLLTNDGGTGGVLSFDKKGCFSFLSTANSLAINARSYTLVNNISTLAGDIAANAAGNYALASTYNAKADGRYLETPIPTTFQGMFEGLGNRIFDLSVRPLRFINYAGLFKDVGASGEVSDLRLVNARGIAYTAVGGIAAQNDGMLSGDSVTGYFLAHSGWAGAIAGINNGTISNSVGATDPLLSEGTSGIAGLNVGMIINSSSSGYAGGEYAGELVSRNQGYIFNSYSTGSVAAGEAGGGLVGTNLGTISNCYSTASVGGGEYLGGLVGSNFGTVTDSYSSGSVCQEYGCYTGVSTYAGGFVGTGNFGYGDDYWDTSTSGIANPSQGDGSYPSVPGITGLTASQFQSGLPAGFSNTTWGQSPSINGGLPYLLANPPS